MPKTKWSLGSLRLKFCPMDNYRFRVLLDSSPLSPDEKYNLNAIFNSLSDIRKIDILDNWNLYLTKIMDIKNLSTLQKNANLQNTLTNINRILDDALARQEAEKKALERKTAEEALAKAGAAKFDRDRQLERIMSLSQKSDIS